MRLSDSYQVKLPESEIELELKVTMYNVNEGHNLELMQRCRDLYEYSAYVGKLRKYSTHYSVKKAVEIAADEFIKEGILKQFLESNRREIMKLSITEFNLEEEWKKIRKDERELGREEGFDVGRSIGLEKGVNQSI